MKKYPAWYCSARNSNIVLSKNVYFNYKVLLRASVPAEKTV